MPKTASWRGLIDPYEPQQALRESASFLRDLRAQFGNWGLAAAAYNAGPKRVEDWLNGRGTLPAETTSYVDVITGLSVDEWTRASGPVDFAARESNPCSNIAVNIAAVVPPLPLRRPPAAEPTTAPWGLQLIWRRLGNPSACRLQEFAEEACFHSGQPPALNFQNSSRSGRIRPLVPSSRRRKHSRAG